MKIPIKTKKEREAIIEGGKRLSFIKNSLGEAVKEGVSAWEIEELANKLIEKSGGEASFKRVPGYRWATCVNVNEGIVHGRGGSPSQALDQGENQRMRSKPD